MSDLSEFSFRVYLAVTQIPVGKVSTYKIVAKAAGYEQAARAVGQVLSINPFAPWVPCHRVVCSNGGIGGFFGSSDKDHVNDKIAMLTAEGIRMTQIGKLSKSEFKTQLFYAFTTLPDVVTRADVEKRVEELKRSDKVEVKE